MIDKNYVLPSICIGKIVQDRIFLTKLLNYTNKERTSLLFVQK
jgi:hypothetical protein